MSFWTAIAVIAIVAIIFGGRKHRHRKAGRRRPDELHGVDEVQAPSLREIELQNEVEELRERVQVLERIATDGRGAQRLADEIESLRSKGKEENR